MAAAAPIDPSAEQDRRPIKPRRTPQAVVPTQPSPDERAQRAAAFLRRGRIQPIRDLLAGSPGHPS